MRTLTRVALLCFLLSPARPLAAGDISVEATRRDEALEVMCRATLQAPTALVWQTLTDYGRLAEFIPGMRSSKVASRNGAIAIVEQSGEVRFLFFTYPIQVTVTSIERPPDLIEARLLKGNLKRLDGAYRILPQRDGTVLLSWNGIVEADSLPPLIGEWLLRSIIEDQFRGMVREIERRSVTQRAQEVGK